MVLFGKLADVERQLVRFGNFSKVLNYLESLSLLSNQNRLKTLEYGKPFRQELLKEEIFSIESTYKTKERNEVPYESHRKYIDLQYIIEGEELIEVNPIEGLSITDEYNEEKDVIFYDNKNQGSLIYMKPRMIAILFPEDAHMPGLIRNISDKVIKSVIKYSTSID